MEGKTPEELREEQIEAQQGKPSKPGHERTAEGEEVETPTRQEFFGNLEQFSRPGDKSNGEKASKPEKGNG